jgi:hypothetical protein
MAKRDILPTIPRRRKSLNPVSNNDDDDDDEDTEQGSDNHKEVVLSPKKKRRYTIQNDDETSTKLLVEQFRDNCFINNMNVDINDDEFLCFSSGQEKDRRLQQSSNQSRFDVLFGCAKTVDSMIVNSTFAAARHMAGQTTNDGSQHNTGMLALRKTQSCPKNLGAAKRRTTSSRSCQSVGWNSRPSLSTINEFQRKTWFGEDESKTCLLSSKSWHGTVGTKPNCTSGINTTKHQTCASRSRSRNSFRRKSSSTTSSSYCSLSSSATSVTACTSILTLTTPFQDGMELDMSVCEWPV